MFDRHRRDDDVIIIIVVVVVVVVVRFGRPVVRLPPHRGRARDRRVRADRLVPPSRPARDHLAGQQPAEPAPTAAAAEP